MNPKRVVTPTGFNEGSDLLHLIAWALDARLPAVPRLLLILLANNADASGVSRVTPALLDTFGGPFQEFELIGARRVLVKDGYIRHLNVDAYQLTP